MIANKIQLSEIFDVTSRTITDWEAKGMPIKNRHGRGKASEYDTSECIDWRLRFMVNGNRHTSAKERREEAEAQLKEIELGEKLEQFLIAEDVELMMASAIIASKVSLLSGARKIKKRIEKESGANIELGFINALIHDALTVLAEGFEVDDTRFNYKDGDISFSVNGDTFKVIKADSND